MEDITIIRKVIKKEEEAIKELYRHLPEHLQLCVDQLYECNGRIMFCGVGKSGHIAKKIAATFASTGTPSFFVHADEALHGDLGMIQAEDIVILFSNSGNTEEIVNVANALKKLKRYCIAVCANTNSKLVKICDLALVYPMIKEADCLELAPTVSSTMMLVLGDGLACALMERRAFNRESFYAFHPGGSLGKKLSEEQFL